jgi:hypothetical protein
MHSQVLQGISKIPRVSIVCKMLDRKDGKALEMMLLKLHPAKLAETQANVGYTVEEWASTRKNLGV